MPPPRADYHMHTVLSCDAQDTMEAMCRAAVEAGLDEIAVTEHLDLHPLDLCPGFYNPDQYVAELARCRELFVGQLTIRAGIEIGDDHRFAAGNAQVVKAHDYDFVIGSVHWIRDEAPFGKEFFLTHEGEPSWVGYLEELEALAEAPNYDVVGHIDLLKREGTEFWGVFEPERYRDELRAVLRTVVERGKGIEINTSGWRRSAGEPCPGLTILRWYAELGGEVLTIGSDAHRTPHVGLFLDEAVALAKQAGLRWLTTFEHRQPIQHPLE